MTVHTSSFRIPFLPAILAGCVCFLAVSLTGCNSSNDNDEYATDMERKDFAIVLHGGAGVIDRDIDPDVRDGYLASLEKALETGRDLLDNGGSSLDAVEQVIRILEDDERFNAGKGAVFTSEERHELDASIMDGRDLDAGAVTGVRTVRNPISLARKVMEESRHVMFAADGAELFADETDVERVENSYFSTDRRREQLRNAREQASVILDHSDDQKDKFSTVGVAALDRDGNLAAGTSTGGMTNKKPGRIGDSPVIAAGTYADNNSCAVSATGHGEKFIRNAVAYQVCAIMEYQGASLEEASRIVIREKLEEGDGGIIAIDKNGNIVMEFSSPGMFRGAADSGGLFEVAIWE
ncbi:isoaspartyl peptidase/L-asparaginase family protein [Natronogracilivirga saccharolytica]|uniref:Isoaspartyl peptidase n=1 Tax=Natronogracilivirga saccharolytica TaxID=2812953 RepID=A0A8J7UWF4_9BACT|nr:isoaspartyl peptidase/L-asparaginase [Natronogracilivirga saccharolytica]MBP3192174.1 isoaspartyl peptidase/L-asparaginase [Natronogracilivirga saccharolytica]